MASIDYACETTPEPGKTFDVAPGVRWLRMPLPLALDHVNLWLLADGAHWAAVDTGLATGEIREHWQTALRQHSLSQLIVTHLHPDHLGNAGWLQRTTGAPLAMTLGEYTSAHLLLAEVGHWAFSATESFFSRHGLGDDMLAALKARGSAFKRGVPEIPLSYRRLLEGDVLRIGANPWRVIVGYGHSPEHASLYCAELGVLISGDMMLPRISTNVPVQPHSPDTDALALFLASIARFRELPADTLVLPSHGKPFRGLHARIAQLEQHHAERCETLLNACKTPQTAAELIPILFDRPINDAHQIFFALGEAIAHLNHLEHAGRLVRREEGSITRYVVPD
jgi:glyoxylase-like metal-dependent hydrolase (beta-lactamase superfamily II)